VIISSLHKKTSLLSELNTFRSESDKIPDLICLERALEGKERKKERKSSVQNSLRFMSL
jgi:hypothetical protein